MALLESQSCPDPGWAGGHPAVPVGVVIIRRASAAEARPLQLRVLRPNGPVPSDVPPSDEWVFAGAFEDGTAIAAATLAPIAWDHPELVDLPAPTWQLRSMAVIPDWRGRGVGSRLLAATVAEAADLGVRSLWADARVRALPFYLRAGWSQHSDTWQKAGVGPHRFIALIVTRPTED